MLSDIVEELFDTWQLVTEMQIRREVEGFLRPDMAKSIASLCNEGTGITEDCLYDCERRRRSPRDKLEIALCKRFGVSSVALLGLGRTKESARWWTWMTTDEKDYLVNRRTVLKSGAVAAGLALPVSDLVYSAQIIGRRKRHKVSPGDVDSAQATATDLATAYAATPDATTRRATRSHALTILDLLKPSNATIDPTTRARLQSVASDACALAGYGDLDAGRFPLANLWFRCALGLAREARDRRLEALALASFGVTSARQLERDHRDAIASLQAAAELGAFLPRAGRAFVLANLADEHAWLGDDLTSGRFLEEVRIAAERVGWDGPGWGWYSTHGLLSGWDGVRPHVFAGSRSLLLGRPAAAIELFDSAFAGTTMPGRRAHLHEDMTNACVALKDPDRACASAIAAMDEAQRYDLAIFLPKIREARATFPGDWSSLATVRELDERLGSAA